MILGSTLVRRSMLPLALSLFAVVLVTVAPRTASADAADTCTATRDGDTVVLEWIDNGGRHVVRRDGGWLATPGSGVDTYTDLAAPQDSTYTIRTRTGDDVSDRTCVADDDPAGSTCRATRSGSSVVVEWEDNGGSHVVRRNGRWLASPGPGTSSHVDDQSPAGSVYELRTRIDGVLFASDCEERPVGPPTAVVERVIHVSIDGLRPDAITAQAMPTLTRLVAEGASTMNARTDPHVTRTLPNHTSQLTGLAMRVHGVDYNEDEGRTVHDEAGRYVPSVFDVVHDNGGRTASLVTKSKFAMHDRSWNGTNGAVDTTGPDDGRDKIDRYARATPENVAQILIDELAASDDLEFAFLHNRYPDRAGHDFGWGSDEYVNAVATSDDILGRVVAAIEGDDALRSTTAVIVVADHGGPLDDNNHADPARVENYTIPFVVWGPTVAPGADLYELNIGRRVDPGVERVWLAGPQPIRGHEVANLSLELLGYPPLPGSTFNAAQDLAIN